MYDVVEYSGYASELFYDFHNSLTYWSLIALHLVTHLGRATAQRELFDAGVLLERIKYFAHYLRDSKKESHIVNLASDALGN